MTPVTPGCSNAHAAIARRASVMNPRRWNAEVMPQRISTSPVSSGTFMKPALPTEQFRSFLMICQLAAHGQEDGIFSASSAGEAIASCSKRGIPSSRSFNCGSGRILRRSVSSCMFLLSLSW